MKDDRDGHPIINVKNSSDIAATFQILNPEYKSFKVKILKALTQTNFGYRFFSLKVSLPYSVSTVFVEDLSK